MSHVDYLSMTKDTQSNETVFVIMECDNKFARIDISKIMFVLVRNLYFVSNVESLTVDSTVLALWLNKVAIVLA